MNRFILIYAICMSVDVISLIQSSLVTYMYVPFLIALSDKEHYFVSWVYSWISVLLRNVTNGNDFPQPYAYTFLFPYEINALCVNII